MPTHVSRSAGIDKSAWQPDAEVAACPICTKPFSLTRRRHHCRLCHRVFCGRCTSRRFTTDFDGLLYGKPQRACEHCHSHLRTGVELDPESVPTGFAEQQAILRVFYMRCDPVKGEQHISVIFRAMRGGGSRPGMSPATPGEPGGQGRALNPTAWGKLRADLKAK
jgi:hypothetical protein